LGVGSWDSLTPRSRLTDQKVWEGKGRGGTVKETVCLSASIQGSPFFLLQVLSVDVGEDPLGQPIAWPESSQHASLLGDVSGLTHARTHALTHSRTHCPALHRTWGNPSDGSRIIVYAAAFCLLSRERFCGAAYVVVGGPQPFAPFTSDQTRSIAARPWLLQYLLRTVLYSTVSAASPVPPSDIGH